MKVLTMWDNFFNEKGMTKAWLDIKTQFSLSNKQHYFWILWINPIPKSWKKNFV